MVGDDRQRFKRRRRERAVPTDPERETDVSKVFRLGTELAFVVERKHDDAARNLGVVVLIGVFLYHVAQDRRAEIKGPRQVFV